MAAEQGNANAQFNLGLRYASGVGVAKDLHKAAYWYRQAASQGHQAARKKLEALASSGL
ncbi:Sel1 repeat protein [compost metagenome]